MPDLRSFQDDASPQDPSGGKLFVGSMDRADGSAYGLTFLCGEEMARVFRAPARVTANGQEWKPSDISGKSPKLSNGAVDIRIEWKYEWEGSTFAFPNFELTAGLHGARRCLRDKSGKVVAMAWQPWKDSDAKKNISEFFWHDGVTLGDHWPSAIFLLHTAVPTQTGATAFFFFGDIATVASMLG